MRHRLAVLWCRWFGHPKMLMLGQPVFQPWPGTEKHPYWLERGQPRYPVQCPRCWLVVDEVTRVEIKGRY